MKVKNKDGKGNPYHDEEGKFTSSDGVFQSLEEIENFVFGSDSLDNLFSQNELDELDEYWNELDKNHLDDDLPELSDDLLELDNIFDENNSFKNSLYLDEIEQFINNLNEKEVVETILGLSNLYELDAVKVSQLSLQKQKELLIAMNIVEGFKNLEEYKEIMNLKNKMFYNLWLNPVSVEDYLEKKDKIIAKKFYFENDYQGTEKEKHLNDLMEFESLGQKYLELSKNFEQKISKYKELISKYENPNSMYSKKRKDSAIWVKYSVEESIKEFADVSRSVLNSVSLKEKKTVIDYTSSYSFINEPLRNKMYYNSGKKNNFVQSVKNMTNVINKSTYDKDIWLQRGVNTIIDETNGIKIDSNITKGQLDQLIGKSFKDQGFVSCGAAKGTGFTTRDIIMNVYCPRGTKMLYMEEESNYSGTEENEMILQRGYTYKITKAELSNGRIYLDVDVLLGSDEEKYTDEQLEEVKNKYFPYD